MDRQSTGKFGEDTAVEYLESLGWRIIERNWRCPAGELDIIAQEPAPCGTLVFCEVKARRRIQDRLPVMPLEAITEKKLRKLRELARYWLRASAKSARHIRIDALGVIISADGAVSVQHRRGIGSR
ncbi:MAG: YraN family protein [Propionibacteriaceae bacterium]|jgi:putative endonuclease|nr:YraN family protein [Propionibacteriaceae bacterium]